MTKIHAFHLLNDFSGSPKVLRQVLDGLVAAGHPVELYTSPGGRGFLSAVPGVRHHGNGYRFVQPVLPRLFLLLYAQLYLIVAGWRRVGPNDVVYVNTLLPFGAAILGRLRGARVVYHLHETSVSPELFKRFLLFWVRICAGEVVYVSDFLARQEPLDKPRRIVWNALPDDFARRAAERAERRERPRNVLMIASLKRYKGVDEFADLAAYCPELTFELVVNAGPAEITDYFAERNLPENLTVFPAQSDVHPFYRRADVVVNLSRPDEWVETFGLTALEGMAYGVPVIVPPVGGIAEIVPDGKAGFHHDGRDTAAIAGRLRSWRTNPDAYQRHGDGAQEQATRFGEPAFLATMVELLGGRRYSTVRNRLHAVENIS